MPMTIEPNVLLLLGPLCSHRFSGMQRPIFFFIRFGEVLVLGCAKHSKPRRRQILAPRIITKHARPLSASTAGLASGFSRSLSLYRSGMRADETRQRTGELFCKLLDDSANDCIAFPRSRHAGSLNHIAGKLRVLSLTNSNNQTGVLQ